MIRWRCKSLNLSGYPKDMQKPRHLQTHYQPMNYTRCYGPLFFYFVCFASTFALALEELRPACLNKCSSFDLRSIVPQHTGTMVPNRAGLQSAILIQI